MQCEENGNFKNRVLFAIKDAFWNNSKIPTIFNIINFLKFVPVLSLQKT